VSVITYKLAVIKLYDLHMITVAKYTSLIAFNHQLII